MGEAALQGATVGGVPQTHTRTPHLKSMVKHLQASGRVLGAERAMTWREQQMAETLQEASVPSTVWSCTPSNVHCRPALEPPSEFALL